ncbi:MAG: MMPL family transporter [Planctomycetes bacterium]|nr:MMPL family transporter [Planctomycetota bacterium]
MKLGTRFVAACTDHPRRVTFVMLALTTVIAILAALPSLWEPASRYLTPVRVDTDPENMLAESEPVRTLHHEMKQRFSLNDMIVVGVVDETSEVGVFQPEVLKRVHALTQFAKGLHWEEDGRVKGVVEVDILAPSTVDNMEQEGLGTVRFDWLMKEPPATQEEALLVRDRAQRMPFLNGTLVSEDGKALAIYLPLTDKDASHRIYTELKQEIATFGDVTEQYHITGLPVAEDTFGVEMFLQMAISAPMAMLVIFLLMLFFFRKLTLVLAPMIVAMVSVIVTMGSLVIAGYPVHIMSSMIPIFIMPIAVLDSVHILSEFFDRYQETRDRRTTILKVVHELFMPMLYTSLTSAAGFASLALTPIPPVQVFGVFVAIGIAVAWILTITFVPAYVMFLKPRSLENFGATHHPDEETTALGKLLQKVGTFTYRRSRIILGATLVLAGIAAWGVSRIVVNDNPVKWFTSSHPIRVADRVLNAHFGGTYMAYLALETEEQAFDAATQQDDLARRAKERGAKLAADDDLPKAPAAFEELVGIAADTKDAFDDRAAWIDGMAKRVQARVDEVAKSNDDDLAYAWDEVSLFVDELRGDAETFKSPAVLRWMETLQESLVAGHVVGKTNSLADIVRTTNRELLLGKDEELRVPDTRNAVAQCLLTFQGSHRANDLWHFVTPDHRTANVWLQLKSGDNAEMTKVVEQLDAFVAANPAPVKLKHDWFGLTYINVIWQDKMVWGMLEAFSGSFLIVFLMMVVLFRSVLWGLLSMIPLTFTIVMIYGVVGLVGKSYDMPVAVLSSLSLGLAVDFAIHFLARSRETYRKHGTWERTVPGMFGEPARAITRNVLVIAIGFTPLLFAPLVPYQTVGFLLASILLVSGGTTLLMLPALLTVLERFAFRRLPNDSNTQEA